MIYLELYEKLCVYFRIIVGKQAGDEERDNDMSRTVELLPASVRHST